MTGSAGRHGTGSAGRQGTGSARRQAGPEGRYPWAFAPPAPIIVAAAPDQAAAIVAALDADGPSYSIWADWPVLDGKYHPNGKSTEEGPGDVPSEGARGVAKDRGPVAIDLGLTPREVEILRAVANGALPLEIARQFYVSPKTVKNHLAHIYAKLHVVSRTQAVARAVKLGIIAID